MLSLLVLYRTSGFPGINMTIFSLFLNRCFVSWWICSDQRGPQRFNVNDRAIWDAVSGYTPVVVPDLAYSKTTAAAANLINRRASWDTQPLNTQGKVIPGPGTIKTHRAIYVRDRAIQGTAFEYSMKTFLVSRKMNTRGWEGGG